MLIETMATLVKQRIVHQEVLSDAKSEKRQ